MFFEILFQRKLYLFFGLRAGKFHPDIFKKYKTFLKGQFLLFCFGFGAHVCSSLLSTQKHSKYTNVKRFTDTVILITTHL